MEFLGIILVVLVICALAWLGIAGAIVFGITKLIGAISQRILGKHKDAAQVRGQTHARPRVRGGHMHSQASSQRAGGPTRPEASTQASTNSVPASRVRSYEYLDVDDGATAETIIKVMRAYEQERVVGFYAQEVINTLNMAELRKKSLLSEIDGKFSQRSISWDHFASTANEALDAIVRNSALLANRVQSFDVEDYERMEHFYRTGGEMRNGKQDPARLQRWELVRETKSEMDDLRAANEKLLLELGKLQSALGKISSNDSTDESSRIADEVSRLAEETKYYQ